MDIIKIALAQINTHVGNIPGNTNKIIEHIKLAKDVHKADIILFPELAIIGYPPEDLVLRRNLYEQIKKAMAHICDHSDDIQVIVGHASYQSKKFFNSCSVIENRKIQHIYHKQLLPNYGVFDEKRYFTPGTDSCVYDYKGIRITLSICEDIWEDTVCLQAAEQGAQLMFNINASPFHINKLEYREKILKQRVSESGLNIIYLNLTGGQDDLVFDGGSMAINKSGKIQFMAPQFEEGLFLLDFHPDKNIFSNPFKTCYTPLSRNESVYKSLVTGVRDYVNKNGFTGALVGLSGGIDSALTLTIAVDALGKDNVEAVIMPSRYTADMSVDDACILSERLGIKTHRISIEKPFDAFNQVLEPVFAGLPHDTTEENIQARCRGILLMALSNKTGKLVLTTGNKSEMAVGYATLYGDMAGGFAPLKDVYKTMVYELSNWRNCQSEVIPRRIIERPPSAELRENQLDQDSLPPYDILDPILEMYIEHDKSPEEIIRDGYEKEIVHKIVLLVDRSEHKRRQSAPGIRITERAFGRDRRYPITSGYKEY